MRNILLFLIVILSLSSCASDRLLNSERIEQRYGNYGIEVLRADAGTRISNLYSEADGIRTMRTLAVVHFAEPMDPRLAAPHAEIAAGASIGATLERWGWRVSKKTLEICRSVPPVAVGYLAAMRIPGHPPLAVHRYRLLVSAGGRPVDYATISEIHHPDYLSLEDLRAIYVDRLSDYVETDGRCVVHR